MVGMGNGSHAAGKATPLPGREAIADLFLADEAERMEVLIPQATPAEDAARHIAALAERLTLGARAGRHRYGGIDAFMHEYALTSEEGVILMCLAEALLRIPDAETADALIAEKIGEGRWERHWGASDSVFVNASTFGLMLTGRVVRLGEDTSHGPGGVLKRLIARSGEPVIRGALRRAMKILGDNFVLGRTIGDALERAQPYAARGYRFSYDMLGERARTARDAERYFARYAAAIGAIGAAVPACAGDAQLMARPSVSVKLSALHARFDPGKERLFADELASRLLDLARGARRQGIGLTVDAEEQDRLDITLEMFQRAFVDAELEGWPGLGLAVQAYGKRAPAVVQWLAELSLREGKRIPVRLVKGAYWDSEIKWAQELGLADYPVYTRKAFTDVSYLACARMLLDKGAAFFPQFATHNAQTIAAISIMGGTQPYELQRLHGMGEALYGEAVGAAKLHAPCRIYAPVGAHEDLVAYLVRRLLENGANTSFVNRLADAAAPLQEIIGDPAVLARSRLAAPRLPRPGEIFLPERRNSAGLALSQQSVRAPLRAAMDEALAETFVAMPIVDGEARADAGPCRAVLSPHDVSRRVGWVSDAEPGLIAAALNSACAAAAGWDRCGGPARALILERAADLYERDHARLMAVMVREAGKTLEGALGDVREAVDFLRYYASEARRLFTAPVSLAGPTGESNTLELRARGPFACISPWNFPLAIFTGQIAAALAAGNPVLAKPAEQTPIASFLAVRLLLEAGAPADVLHLLPGSGRIGSALIKQTRVAGVAFTGSNATAAAILQGLAGRGGAMVPFIAETGGLNAMIADSSALPEQVVRDLVRSAFDSAGQRCSAARLFFVQADVEKRTLEMLTGAVEALRIGDPLDYATDVGPVIDEAARQRLEAHKARMRSLARPLVDLPLPPQCRGGTYVTPAVYALTDAGVLKEEVFGPILHVVPFAGGHLERVIDAINASGYGLTLGLHSRIAAVWELVAERARVGNLYINRNQIGAVVGVQPFGGEALSGTGPKAGGPNYLARFATERVRTRDVTATGGNVALIGRD
jgi:RHH-type transcriptional regulator, proline utilization regulon repressor / proline dehydrogenase / delta 1-pyrroline-5-carboxylate dehydrogenase